MVDFGEEIHYEPLTNTDAFPSFGPESSSSTQVEFGEEIHHEPLTNIDTFPSFGPESSGTQQPDVSALTTYPTAYSTDFSTSAPFSFVSYSHPPDLDPWRPSSNLFNSQPTLEENGPAFPTFNQPAIINQYESESQLGPFHNEPSSWSFKLPEVPQNYLSGFSLEEPSTASNFSTFPWPGEVPSLENGSHSDGIYRCTDCPKEFDRRYLLKFVESHCICLYRLN